MRIVREGHSKTPVLYRLAERDGGWRIYDVVIGGVSMASTFRASFRQQLRDGGVDGLIQSLRDRSA
jgi:phospholipid transport system substrate-binding protein